ncbi:MAG: preprotein translocase subunit SecE [Clostridia bacterium]|nr:preprotein translocase subunit SecE [Clostridia bacterium]
MGVLGALIIVGVVFAIIKREKLKVWWLSYKSELKKIVWSSPDQVKKNTIVVVVVVLATAIVIGLLDFAFTKGIFALGNLF